MQKSILFLVAFSSATLAMLTTQERHLSVIDKGAPHLPIEIKWDLLFCDEKGLPVNHFGNALKTEHPTFSSQEEALTVTCAEIEECIKNHGKSRKVALTIWLNRICEKTLIEKLKVTHTVPTIHATQRFAK